MTGDGVWLGLDVGTQSVKAMAVREDGEILSTASHPLASRRTGREHTQDPWAWWDAVAACCRHVAAAVSPAALCGLALDGTSGTVLLTDDALRPASEALMYDDSRASEEALEVDQAGSALWQEMGYRMQPSWALPKLLWLTRHTAGHRRFKLTHQNDFICAQLAGKRLAADWSNALKTGYDLHRLRWPMEVCEQVGLGEALFPEVVAPGTVIGQVGRAAAALTHLPPGLPIMAGMTDGCAAQIASGTVGVGSWNSVIGTTLVLKGVTAERLRDPSGVVYSHRSPEGRWLPGGASSTGAGSLARDLPGADLQRLSREAEHRGPTALVAYPLVGTGERFPFHAPDAEGFLLGVPGDDVDRYRAVLQGICMMERLAFDSLEMLGAPLDGVFTISGGAVKSSLWNSMRASMLERTLLIPNVTEGALGMAVLARSSGSSLEAAAAQMVRPGVEISPREPFADVYGESYRTLLGSLAKRGWLPEQTAGYALGKLEAAG